MKTRIGLLLTWGALLLAFSLNSGCDHHHGSGSGGGGGSAGPAWYDVYGFYCGSGIPYAGCNFYWDGTKIIDIEDPYFYSNYNLQYGTWYYTDSWGFSSTYTGWAWLSPTGILYDDWGNALNKKKGGNGLDVVADVSEYEDELAKVAGKDFAERYALSEEKGIEIARIVNDYMKLSRREKRTEADLEAFSNNLYGVNLADVERALSAAKKGDLSLLEAENEKVAEHWGTTPENSASILKNIYANELRDFGL